MGGAADPCRRPVRRGVLRARDGRRPLDCVPAVLSAGGRPRNPSGVSIDANASILVVDPAVERYWMGPEFVDFRTMHSSHYQVPVVYGWTDLVVGGALPPEAVAASSGDEAGTARGDLAG